MLELSASTRKSGNPQNRPPYLAQVVSLCRPPGDAVENRPAFIGKLQGSQSIRADNSRVLKGCCIRVELLGCCCIRVELLGCRAHGSQLKAQIVGAHITEDFCRKGVPWRRFRVSVHPARHLVLACMHACMDVCIYAGRQVGRQVGK